MNLDISKLSKWKCIKEYAVGGLEWIGFSKEQPEKFICISSQKTTLFDCYEGTMKECDCEYDEESFIAICDLLPKETIDISGQYGGKTIKSTQKNEYVRIETSEDYITSVYFIDDVGNEDLIFKDYGYYTCTFNNTGEFFAFSQDAGITILQRIDF